MIPRRRGPGKKPKRIKYGGLKQPPIGRINDKRYKLTEDQRREIRAACAAGERKNVLAWKYKVHVNTIGAIVGWKALEKGRNWRKLYKREKHAKNMNQYRARRRKLGTPLTGECFK